jgi:hypothetical protein
VKGGHNKALCQVIKMLRQDELVVSVVAVKDKELGIVRIILSCYSPTTGIQQASFETRAECAERVTLKFRFRHLHDRFREIVIRHLT